MYMRKRDREIDLIHIHASRFIFVVWIDEFEEIDLLLYNRNKQGSCRCANMATKVNDKTKENREKRELNTWYNNIASNSKRARNQTLFDVVSYKFHEGMV